MSCECANLKTMSESTVVQPCEIATEFIANLMYYRIPVRKFNTWKLGKIVEVRVDQDITISCSCGAVQGQPQIETTVVQNGVCDEKSVLRHDSLLSATIYIDNVSHEKNPADSYFRCAEMEWREHSIGCEHQQIVDFIISSMIKAGAFPPPPRVLFPPPLVFSQVSRIADRKLLENRSHSTHARSYTGAKLNSLFGNHDLL